MEEWLVSGDPLKAAHAKARIAIAELGDETRRPSVARQAPSPDDLALQAYIVRRGGCCGG